MGALEGHSVEGIRASRESFTEMSSHREESVLETNEPVVGWRGRVNSGGPRIGGQKAEAVIVRQWKGRGKRKF